VQNKSFILLMLIVVLPLGGLTWLGVRVARDDEAALKQRFEEVFATQLHDIDGVVSRHFESTSIELRNTARQVESNPDSIRALIRRTPKLRQVLVLDNVGSVLHPDSNLDLNLTEREFLHEAQELIRDRDLIHVSTGQSDSVQKKQQAGAALPTRNEERGSLSATPGGADEGWHAWYWGRGVHLIYWQRRSDGTVVGLFIERGRWMADLIAALPETMSRQHDGASVATTARFRLIDSMGQSMYEWGEFEPPDGSMSLTETAVSSPLTSWRLQAFVPDSLLAGARRGTAFQLASGIGAVAGALAVLVTVFWREYSREVRQASQRVSFVNQVSHELKTPLTNIRMYADLLADDLENLEPSTGGKSVDRLRVIISESQRLSRLISNVLTFGRQQRDALILRPRPASPDELVRRVVEQFRPNLSRLGIQTELNLDVEQPMMIDPDAVEQILVNLISNVEKYAADGKLLKIETCRDDSTLRVIVSDAGPGIPLSMQRTVFEPFVRVSSRLEDAAGTGIGLSIARDLARLHGGDLTMMDSKTGARFSVELRVSNEVCEA
tara:strand:- start:9023 stop:10681 length:1659 start_codon:yes stop_codon:yes gene_type:complete